MQVPEGWVSTLVGKACQIKNNLRKPISADERSTMLGVYPYFGPTGILDYLNEYKIDEEFALIGEDGDHFLKFADREMTLLYEGKANVNNHAHIIVDSHQCRARWFYLYFMHKDITAFLTRQGAKRYKLTKASLEQLPLLVPPLQEQNKIAQILSTWDKAITTTEQLLANSQQQKKALMQQLLTGKKRLLDNNGQRFGEAWKNIRLKEILREEKSRNRDNLIERVLSVTNHSGFVLPENQFSKRVASDNVSNYKVVKKGQFGYNPSRLNVGSFARLDGYDEGILSPMYVVFSINKKLVNSDYLMNWMDSNEARQRILGSIQGSVRESVGFEALCGFPFKLPPLGEQQKIAAVLTAADQEIATLEQKLEHLKQEKKALMQQLLTGKRRIAV